MIDADIMWSEGNDKEVIVTLVNMLWKLDLDKMEGQHVYGYIDRIRLWVAIENMKK